jgi:hypothetical protein
MSRTVGVMIFGWQAVQGAKTEQVNDPEENLASLMIDNRTTSQMRTSQAN